MIRYLLTDKAGAFRSERRTWRLLLMMLVAAVLQSCATYGRHAVDMRDGLLSGKPDLALAVAEEKDPEQKEVISSLNKGMLRRINHKYDASNQAFEVAKQEIEQLYGVSVTENLAAVTINETLRGYEGDRYEQLLLHAYMAMNYIQLGDVDAARVEMLQADVKMREWGEDEEDDAFVRYLAGLVYEALGEYDEALISYRKAYRVYKEKGGSEYPPTPLNLKKDLLRLTAKLGLWNEYRQFKKTFGLKHYKPPKASKKYGELVVILNNGLAPIRSETSIQIWSDEVQKNLRIAFPTYRTPKARLNRARISVETMQAGFETVEDVDALARHALEQAMPGILARATARAVVKYNTQHSAENESALAGFLMTVTNMVTERADTRSWTTLPEEIQLQRLRLPVGRHRVTIDILNDAGYTIDSMAEEVEIKPGRLSFLIHHWIAPVVKPKSTHEIAGNVAAGSPATKHDDTDGSGEDDSKEEEGAGSDESGGSSIFDMFK